MKEVSHVNTFALTFRPDEIRLFIVVFAAVVSATLAAVARSLRAMLVHDLERGRRGILSPLGQVLASPISVARGASASKEVARLECGWIVDGAGHLMCRWRVRRTDPS
jgi:hypothetical protein